MKIIILILLLNPLILFAQFNGYFEIGKDVETDVSYTDIIDHYCSHAVYSRNNWHKYNEPVNNSKLTKIYARYNFR